MLNCMTYALDIENLDLENTDSFLYPHMVKDYLKALADKYNRNIRKVDSEFANLLEGEWLILFLGLKVVHRDYEGLPDGWEYHFSRLVNGVWLNRPSYKSDEIEPFTKEEKEELLTAGYPIAYYAVSRKDE